MGYIGNRRSERSQDAIDNYELPLALINKDNIYEFLGEIEDDINKEEYIFIEKLPIALWKFVATEKCGASSWHHTGKYFRETDHYNLYDIVEKILDERESIKKQYSDYRKEKSKEKLAKKLNYEFGVISVQIWGGTRKHPKLIGSEEVSGIIIGDWLHYEDEYGVISRYNIYANKTEWYKTFNSYSELVKKFPKYKGTKKLFNKLIKEKVK